MKPNKITLALHEELTKKIRDLQIAANTFRESPNLQTMGILRSTLGDTANSLNHATDFMRAWNAAGFSWTE